MGGETKDGGARPGLLFLVRRAAGSIGGVQSHGSRLAAGLAADFDLEQFFWPGPLWASPFLMPRFQRKAAAHPAKLVHCDDALTGLMGARLARREGKKVVATVHGMDVVLPFGPYQRRLRRALPGLHRVVCVSRATADRVIERGVDPGRVVIIPNAAEEVAEPLVKGPELLARIRRRTGIDLSGKRLLFSLGRPVVRKGFDFFASQVLPRLPGDCVYIVAGPTAAVPPVIKAVGSLLGRRTRRLLLVSLGLYTSHQELVALNGRRGFYYLTDIDDELRNLLLHAAELLIMPNIVVPGDMEGFGIVALEASVRGVPVAASGIEGITDAVTPGKNGILLPAGDAEAQAEAIAALLADRPRLAALGRSAAAHARERFSLGRITEAYRAIFQELAAE